MSRRYQVRWPEPRWMHPQPRRSESAKLGVQEARGRVPPQQSEAGETRLESVPHRGTGTLPYAPLDFCYHSRPVRRDRKRANGTAASAIGLHDPGALETFIADG